MQAFMNISESDTGLYIDVGSTSVKFASKKDRGAIPFPPPVTKGEIFEVETQPIVEIIRKLIGMHEECRDIFFSVQMHGYVLSSRKTGMFRGGIDVADKRSLKHFWQNTAIT